MSKREEGGFVGKNRGVADLAAEGATTKKVAAANRCVLSEVFDC